MGNDFVARKQRRKRNSQDGDGAPRRIRKKKQPKRICRGPCHKPPVLDLDSSDEDMIATVRSATRIADDTAPKKMKTPIDDASNTDKESQKKKKKKLSTSAKLTLPPQTKQSKEGSQKTASFHPLITAFLKSERIATPLPLQSLCWPAVLQGENVYVTAQPGSGKTLSYLLPIACKLADSGHSMSTRPEGPLALVLLPTRELAQQVGAVCKRIKRRCGVLRVACLTGGSDKQKQAESLRRCPHIVVATPGRLVDMLEDGALRLDCIEYVVLDEADKMLSLGFSDQLDKIRLFLRTSGISLPGLHDDHDGDGDDGVVCHVGLYSATNPSGVRAMSRVWCGTPTLINLATSTATNEKSSMKSEEQNDDGGARISENVVQVVHVCADHKKMAKLAKHLGNIEGLHKDQRHRPKVLIFANRIKTVKTIARELRQLDKKVTEIHGDKSQEEREKAIHDFKGGKFNILIASDVAARGLHVKNLSYVVNYDFPSNLETYIHRVGRTGRVDAQGHAFSFFTRSLASLAEPMIKLLESHNQDIDPNLIKLAESYAIIQEKLKEQGGADAIKATKKTKKDTPILPVDAEPQNFIQSTSFQGIKTGYYFSTGSKGLGYYLDAPRFSRMKKKTTKPMLPGKLARMKRRALQGDLSSDDEE